MIRTGSRIEKDNSEGFVLFPIIMVSGVYKGRNFELSYILNRQSWFSLTLTLATGSKSSRKLLLLHPNRVKSTDKQIVSTDHKKFDSRIATCSRPKYFAKAILDTELQDRLLSTIKIRYSYGELTIYPSGRITIRQGIIWRYHHLENIFSLLHDIGDNVERTNNQHQIDTKEGKQV